MFHDQFTGSWKKAILDVEGRSRMIIIGWGHRKTQNLGPVEKRNCPNCGNTDFWELHRLKDYATFFFIPVIPYKTEHLLVCPVCKAAYEVTAAELPDFEARARQNLARLK